MVHESLPILAENAFGSHPRRVFSVRYELPIPFHGANTGSNPVGDAKSFNNLRALRFSRGTVISRKKHDWWANPRCSDIKDGEFKGHK